MAKSWKIGDIQEFQSSRGKTYLFVPGVFESIEKIEETLRGNIKVLKNAQIAMRDNIAKCHPHDFQHMRVSFPVRSLQHVTVRSALYGMVQLEGFIPSRDENEERPAYKDLSSWSAQISGEDIEDGRGKTIEKVRSVISPEDAQKYQREIQKQFSQSPAFLSSSRYGQYKFSFPLSDLLSWYGDQFCQGGKPQLRILGTEVYRLKIGHCIVVHGPDTDLYNHLPMVPTVQSEEDPLDFVYWMDDTLYWRPESTSNLYVRILNDGSVLKECYRNCENDGWYHCIHLEDGIYAPWNHLEIGFHIPPERHLQISRQDLLKNLTTCEKAEIYLGKESDPDPSEVIKQIKKVGFIYEKWSRCSGDCVPAPDM